MSNARYPQPPHEDAFEDFCLELLRKVLSLPNLDRYGHRGERQDGVDLLDMDATEPLVGAQCKHHASHKTLPPHELEAEIEKAKRFQPPLGRFYILTSAKRSVQAQKAVVGINKQHAAAGLFRVTLWTWEEIERRLDQHPELQGLLPLVAPNVVATVVEERLAALAPAAVGSAHFDSELDHAKQDLDQGEFARPKVLLSRLRSNHFADLTDGQKSRLFTLLANAELSAGDMRHAAKLLLEAAKVDNSARAHANVVLAHQLLGDPGAAAQIAARLAEEHPDDEHTVLAQLRTAASPETLRRVWETSPGHLRQEPELVVTVTMRAVELGDWELAASVVDNAVTLAPDDPRASLAKGVVTLRRQLDIMDPEHPSSTEIVDEAEIEAAIGALTKSEGAARKRHQHELAAVALVHRAQAHHAVGRFDAARADVVAAGRIAEKNRAVTIAHVNLLMEDGKYAEAVGPLREALARHAGDADLEFLLGLALWNRDERGDREEATNFFSVVSTRGGVHASRALFLAVDGAIRLGRVDDAARVQEEAKADPCLLLLLRAKVRQAQGHDDALTLAKQAIGAKTPSTTRVTLLILARFLASLGEVSSALKLWSETITIHDVGTDAYVYLDVAWRARDFARILEFAQKVRDAGILDEHVLEYELQVLDRYDPERSVEVLQHYVSIKGEDKRVRLHLAHLGMRLDRRELWEPQLDHLPSAVEATATEGEVAAAVLHHAGRHIEAIEYSYELLRRNLEDVHAHRAFRNAVLFTPDDTRPGRQAADVGPGSAVAYTEPGDEQRHWYVIQDVDTEPLLADEIAADSQLAQRLHGRRPGDEVVLADGPAGGRRAVVRDVVSKYTYRFRDVLNSWQLRFPEHAELWMMRMSDDDTGAPNVEPLIEMMRNQRAAQEAALDEYAKKFVPIHVLAGALGRDEFEAAGIVATNGRVKLRCCFGTRDAFAQARAALDDARVIVIDITVMATLSLLRLWDILSKLPFEIRTSAGTMDLLRRQEASVRGNARAAGTLDEENGRPRYTPHDESCKRKDEDEHAAFVSSVTSSVRILGAPALAMLPKEERDEMEGLIGQAGAEAAVLAAGPGIVLWTDDLAVEVVARQRQGVRRVWTQAVLMWLLDQGYIAADTYAEASAKLVALGYTFTSVNDAVVRRAGALAGWRADRWPCPQLFDYLGEPSIDQRQAAVLVAEMIVAVHGDSALGETRKQFTIAALEMLSARGDGPAAIKILLAVLPKLFGLNVVGQAEALATVEAWSKFNAGRVVISTTPSRAL